MLLIYTSIAIYETSSCFTSSQTVAIGSQNVHSLIPITCKYAMFCGKKTLQIYTENSLLIQFLSEDLLSSLLLKSGPTLYILSLIIRKNDLNQCRGETAEAFWFQRVGVMLQFFIMCTEEMIQFKTGKTNKQTKPRPSEHLGYILKLFISDTISFPGGSGGKESACSVGDLGSIPGLGRSPGVGHGSPSRYSCLQNTQGQRSLVGCSPWAARSRTWVSD